MFVSKLHLSLHQEDSPTSQSNQDDVSGASGVFRGILMSDLPHIIYVRKTTHAPFQAVHWCISYGSLRAQMA